MGLPSTNNFNQLTIALVCILLVSFSQASPSPCDKHILSSEQQQAIAEFEQFAYQSPKSKGASTNCNRPAIKVEKIENSLTNQNNEVGKDDQSSMMEYPQSGKQCSINQNWRFDCHPESGAAKDSCESRGCCWAPAIQQTSDAEFLENPYSLGVPSCFYPTNFPTYFIYNSSTEQNTRVIYLKRNASSHYPEDVMLLRMDIKITDVVANIKIYDPIKKRYEVPIPYPGLENDKLSPKNPLLEVVVQEPFTLKIIHKVTNEILFDISKSPLIYANQFIQFSTPTPSKYLYGLGERRDNFLRSFNWKKHILFAADQQPRADSNLYGSHPFYLNLLKNGNAHGIFLLNSNAIEVILQPAPALTFRLLGGIIDLYTFAGPSPADVIKQYTKLIGRPILPPYWGLGFQMCRWNYGSTEKTRLVWQRTRDANIPFDVQWNDIDYMDQQRDFTYDRKNYAGLPKLVEDIHNAGMHYVPIIDPAIDVTSKHGAYPPYDEGIKQDIFIKDKNGKPFIGKVWPPHGAVWPDFTNPKTISYWTKQNKKFYEKIPFDGLWTDMNEPSNFYDGADNGCPSSSYEDPPYVPEVNGGKLWHRTVCMTAQQYSSMHYDVHNLYGITEAIATNSALKTIRNKRPFIISRSTFPGHGHYAGHWSGDIRSSWDDMRKSIPNILDMSLFGIPLMGADICGFSDNTTVKLCQRWMELGAFYPFSRNHNTNDTMDQDPVSLGDEVVRSSINALHIRYMLLPHLYTQFYKAATFGETVVRPVFFEFPEDKNTYGIDTQFLWGPSVMILPVLQEDETTVNAYLPAGIWYLLNTMLPIISNGGTYGIDAPLDTINVVIRGGHVIPIQAIASTTTESRKNQFGLIAALDKHGLATGQLYWDDGDSLKTLENGAYNLINFTVNLNSATTEILKHGASQEPMPLGFVTIFGMPRKPKAVVANGKPYPFTYYPELQVLNINGMTIPMAKTPIKISWT